MSTRTLGYLGLGVLVAIIGAAFLGVPPFAWLAASLLALVAGVIVVARLALNDGTDIAGRILALNEHQPRRTSDAATNTDTPQGSVTRIMSTKVRLVDVELVRLVDEPQGKPAVWLHRCGGRRVHRFATADGWVLQQVSTKDPDNPRKRIIGQSFTFASDADATSAADDLARGFAPTVSDAPGRLDPTVVAA
jgi:hypothetical protein